MTGSLYTSIIYQILIGVAFKANCWVKNHFVLRVIKSVDLNSPLFYITSHVIFIDLTSFSPTILIIALIRFYAAISGAKLTTIYH